MRCASGPLVEVLANPIVSKTRWNGGSMSVVPAGICSEARALGLLRATDRITMNRDRLLADAKALALARVQEGYQRPSLRPAIAVGGAPLKAALDVGIHLALRAGRISDHDARIGRALAPIKAGGAVPHAAYVSEQHLLDLEREAFLGLCGQPKTLERIAHTLKAGKPLRN